MHINTIRTRIDTLERMLRDHTKGDPVTAALFDLEGVLSPIVKELSAATVPARYGRDRSDHATVLSKASAAIREWRVNRLEAVTRHFTHFNSFNDLVKTDLLGIVFDCRLPGMAFLAERYNMWQEQNQKTKRATCIHFPIPTQEFDPETFKVTLEWPDEKALKEDLRERVMAGTLKIPAEYLMDSKKFFDDRAHELSREYRKRHQQAESRANDAWKAKMTEDFDLKRFNERTQAKIHHLAWANGHSDGLSACENQYHDLVELAETFLPEPA